MCFPRSSLFSLSSSLFPLLSSTPSASMLFEFFPKRIGQITVVVFVRIIGSVTIFPAVPATTTLCSPRRCFRNLYWCIRVVFNHTNKTSEPRGLSPRRTLPQDKPGGSPAVSLDKKGQACVCCD